MEHDVFLRFEAIDVKLAQILVAVQRTESQMGLELDELTAEVSRNTSVDQSAIALLNGLRAKLDEVIASNDPQQLVALRDSLATSSDGLAAAVAANTPAPAPNA
jgi:hypothetical protein